jgi:dipeptidyl aminopeptidase/acylaminoacyl peptidase
MKNVLIAAGLVLATAATSNAQTASTDAAARRSDRRSNPLAEARGSRRSLRTAAGWPYTVRETNWDDNAYETEIWLADVSTGSTRQLTNGKKSSQSPSWAPDGSKLAFISDRTDKRQIYLISPQGGEGEALTSLEDGVSNFAWSPDATNDRVHRDRAEDGGDQGPRKEVRRIPGRRAGPSDDAPVHDRRRDAHDSYADERRVHRRPVCVVARRQSIAFDHTVNPALANGGSANISIVTSPTRGPPARGAGRPRHAPGLVARRLAHRLRDAMANPAFFYSNGLIAIVPAGGGTPTVVSAAFDEDPSIVAWKPGGLFFAASARTYAYLYKLNPDTKAVTKVSPVDRTVNSSFSLSKDGETIASLRADARTMSEVYVVSG